MGVADGVLGGAKQLRLTSSQDINPMRVDNLERDVHILEFFETLESGFNNGFIQC
jgi:hypothetical protein